MDEVPLPGGNFGASVRIGDTVHRRAGPWTPAVHALLAHLDRVGFGAAPKGLGIDERGRAVQSFLLGEVHPGWPDPLPLWMFEDEGTLIAAAKLLRRYHDSIEGFVPPAEARWRFVAPGAHEVICHNDWSPANALFRGHAPVAMLDWDSAGPGSRVWDIATSAYWWVPLKPRLVPPSLAAKATRFALFCDAYGADVSRPEVLDTLIEQLLVLGDFVQAEADAGDPGYAKLAGWNIPAVVREDSSLLVQQRDVLLSDP